MRELKKASHAWAREAKDGTVKPFAWQAGYGAFSVEAAHIDHVQDYIRRQPEHHAKLSFQDELRAICLEYGIDIDERYVWS